VALSWFGSSRKAKANGRRTKKEAVKLNVFKPHMETLENRLTPAGSVIQFHIAAPSGAPTFTLGGTDLLIAEPTAGSTNLTVTVDRTGDISGPATVDFATVDETASAGVNYTTTGGTLQFAAGQASAQINVPILHTTAAPDGSLSGPKVFAVTLSNPSSGDTVNVLADVSAVTIKDTNGTQNARYINDVFFELLNRPADPGAIQFFGGLLNGGASKGSVLSAIESSVFNGHNEYFDNTVNRLFQSYLGRNADAGGLAAFSGQLTAGATIQLVQSEIMGSDEYFQISGSTNVGFISQAYRDLLNRNPDAGGLTFYLNMLSTPSTATERQAVIANLLGQVEQIHDVLNLYYANYLNRLSDPAGFNFYTLQLQNGVSYQQTVNEFLGSTDEYFNGC
jgi:hypothetical protein